MRNVELKARCRDLQKARRIAESLPAQLLAEGEQTDMYFEAPPARMKLRESTFEDKASLIWYMRPNSPEPKPSEYRISRIRNPEKLRDVLSAHFAIKAVVRKRRAIFLYRTARIHLDEIDDLGGFIEFEAPSEDSDEQAARIVDELTTAFAISPNDLVAGSYSDLLPPGENS